MGRPKGKPTTLVRIHKDILQTKIIKFPQYTPNEIFKIGLSVVNGMETAGRFIYGNVWQKPKKK